MRFFPDEIFPKYNWMVKTGRVLPGADPFLIFTG